MLPKATFGGSLWQSGHVHKTLRLVSDGADKDDNVEWRFDHEVEVTTTFRPFYCHSVLCNLGALGIDASGLEVLWFSSVVGC